MSHPLFASLTFRFIYSIVAQNTTSVPGQKNTNTDSISLQPPNQIISKVVGVLFFIFEVLRAHRRMLAGFLMSMFRFNKINPLPPLLLLFTPTFTVNRYGKEYPILFTSNIATAENDTYLRHWFQLLSKSTCEAHSLGLTPQITLDPFPFAKFCSLVMGFRISIFCHFEKVLFLTKSKTFAPFCSELSKDLSKQKKFGGL